MAHFWGEERGGYLLRNIDCAVWNMQIANYENETGSHGGGFFVWGEVRETGFSSGIFDCAGNCFGVGCYYGIVGVGGELRCEV